MDPTLMSNYFRIDQREHVPATSPVDSREPLPIGVVAMRVDAG